jgi:uncharacterized protein (DUF58 family)
LSRFHQFIYPGHVRITRSNPGRKRRPSSLGQFVLGGGVMCATIGIDTDLTLSYQLFTLLASLYLLASLASQIHKPQIKVTRILPAFATAGEVFTYKVKVVNKGQTVIENLKVLDAPKVIAPGLEEYLTTPEPLEEQRNAYDRFIGYHRYVWLQRRKTGLVPQQSQVPIVPVGGEASTLVEAKPLRRGIINFSGITISKPDPMGLVERLSHFRQIDKLVVLPRRYRISASYKPPGGRHYQPGGVNRSRSVGDSEEFVSLRDYRAGDMVRRIHWPSLAKRNKPVVKEFQDEYFVRQALLLDTCCDDWELLEEIVSIAASFAVTLTTSDSLLDLMFLADKVHTFTTGRSLAHEQQLLEVLASIEKSEQPFESLSNSVLQHAPLLSGCIMIASKWNESRRTLTARLESLGIPVEIIVVTRSYQPDSAGVHFFQLGKIEKGLANLTSKLGPAR